MLKKQHLLPSSSKQQKFIVRNIEKSDLEQVYLMLLSLCKYEKLDQKFKLTKEKMFDSLFSKNPDWFCLVIQGLLDNDLKGFLLYTLANINRAFHLIPLFHIDHLYIKPDYQNMGLGSRLINELKSNAKKKGVNRLEAWCMKTNEIGNRFYKKIGAEKMDFVTIYRINIP